MYHVVNVRTANIILTRSIVLASFLISVIGAADVVGKSTATRSTEFCNSPNFRGHCDNVLIVLPNVTIFQM